MLERSWIEKDRTRVSYNEDEDSENELEETEDFERKFNFRHEEESVSLFSLSFVRPTSPKSLNAPSLSTISGVPMR